MKKITTVLFDFDGVVTDTEPQYDVYMDDLGKKYLNVDNLASLVKGVTSTNIMKKHFSHLSPEDIETINNGLEEFEKNMDFPPVDGAIEFIHHLKQNNYNVGLVTSSQSFKMEIALNELNLTNTFDVEIMADHITEGKPNPMCYLLAAQKLNVSPSECLVFEDSFFGIQAATEAGMQVVGLSTTIPAESLKEKVDIVIPNFKDKNRLLKILE